MESNWLQNEFIWKELRAPYIINYDTDYYETLKDKYEILLNQAIKAKADGESIEIIKNYKKEILEALNAYYSADLSESSTIIRNLINDIGDDPFAVNTLQKSAALGEVEVKKYSFLDVEREILQVPSLLRKCYIFLKK